MESIERKSSEESPTLAERKQRKAEFIRRLSENHMVATSALPWCDFKAFPQYMLSATLPTKYIQGLHIGSVRPT